MACAGIPAERAAYQFYQYRLCFADNAMPCSFRLCNGGDLSQWLRENGRMNDDMLVDLLSQMKEALGVLRQPSERRLHRWEMSAIRFLTLSEYTYQPLRVFLSLLKRYKACQYTSP